MKGLFQLAICLALACVCLAEDKDLLKKQPQRNVVKKYLSKSGFGLNSHTPLQKSSAKNLLKHKDEKHSDDEIPTLWQNLYSKQHKYKPLKRNPLRKDSKHSAKDLRKPERSQHTHSRPSEAPKNNKFKNLLSKLTDKKTPPPQLPKQRPQIMPKRERAKAPTPKHSDDTRRQPHKKERAKIPTPKHSDDAFDEYQDRNNVLISVPLEILKQLGHRYSYEPTEKTERRHKPERPPKTINPPRKVTFDHGRDVDTEGRVNANFEDKGVKFAAGSYQDKVYSQWYVVTNDGLEYDGDTDELNTIFELANKQNLPSTSDVIPDSMLNALNTMGTIQHEQSSVPPDSRKLISKTDQYPYSVIGRLDAGCTGTLIGPNHVLTAGHCVYEFEKKMWFKNLDFHRGKSCDPNTGELYSWKLAITVKGWKDFGYPSYDYAIIVVSKTSPQWMTFGWSNSLHKANTQVVGYPSDKEDRCMWESSCTIGQEWNDLLGYKCDTVSGMSGGPVYR